jgi:hypothetical protein
MIQKAITFFTTVNKIPPQRIIVFKSGLSLQQVKNTQNVEYPVLREMLNSIDKNIKLVVLNVNKNDNVKFYATSKSNP